MHDDWELARKFVDNARFAILMNSSNATTVYPSIY